MAEPSDHAPSGSRRYRPFLRLPWRHRPTDPVAELEALRALRAGGPPASSPGRPRLGWRRALRWFALAVAVWLGLGIVLFFLSAQMSPGVSDQTKQALDGGGLPPFSATTILVLGSDQRSKKTHEPGASTSGPSRSDVMLLIRTGGGHSARLSIPRDTVVDVPGHGLYKINAAYAFGGAALAIATVKQYLGIKINHVVEVNFDNFPQLVDAMGGVDFTSSTCIVSRINGGYRNGGYTLRLRRGTHHLNGTQALALARTRHNDCHPGESDLTRVMRQQAIFQAMKSRLPSFSSFVRLPFVAWAAPKTIKTDMGPFNLLGLFASLEVNGSPATRLLEPSGTTTLPDGEVGLTVSDASRRAAVQQFLSG
jgi:LCP family protein required for cell wall assembly